MDHLSDCGDVPGTRAGPRCNAPCLRRRTGIRSCRDNDLRLSRRS